MEQQQGSARETHSAKGQAQKSATILHYTDMSRHFITRERCEIVYLCLFLTIYYITLQRASYRPLCSPWSGTSHPSNSRRLECFRLKPTLSLLIIFYHHYKYKIQPGGMRVLSPHASKLFGALRHEVFHSGPDQIQCWTQHHQRMGRHWFRPQCNRSLPLFISKKQLAIVLEFVKPMKLPNAMWRHEKEMWECVDDLCIWQSKHSYRHCVHPTTAVFKHSWSFCKGDTPKNTSASPKLR